MKLSFTVSEKALKASYHVTKLIARPKKPHTIGESLLRPTCLEIVRLMLGPKEVKEVRNCLRTQLKDELTTCKMIYLKL